jgi:hypothetical protein
MSVQLQPRALEGFLAGKYVRRHFYQAGMDLLWGSELRPSY